MVRLAAFIEGILRKTFSIWTEATSRETVFKDIPVVPGWFALAQPKDVCQAQPDGDGRDNNGSGERRFECHEENEEQYDGRPTPPTSHQNRPPSKPHVRPLESEAAFVSVRRSSVFMVARGGWWRAFSAGTKNSQRQRRCWNPVQKS